MNLEHIKQIVSRVEIRMEENRLTTAMIVIAGLTVLIIFGGLLLDGFLERRRERQKVKAVERLHKYIQSHPGSKS